MVEPLRGKLETGRCTYMVEPPAGCCCFFWFFFWREGGCEQVHLYGGAAQRQVGYWQVHLYGGAASLVVVSGGKEWAGAPIWWSRSEWSGLLAGAPIWWSRQFFFFGGGKNVWAGAPIWWSRSETGGLLAGAPIWWSHHMAVVKKSIFLKYKKVSELWKSNLNQALCSQTISVFNLLDALVIVR